jgi:hypothetical protein
MITAKQFAAVLGFAFVAVWIDASFGGALACLAGALVFYAAASFYQGDLEREVGEIQSRLRPAQGASEPGPAYATRPAAPPPPRAAAAPPPPPAAATPPTAPRVR